MENNKKEKKWEEITKRELDKYGYVYFILTMIFLVGGFSISFGITDNFFTSLGITILLSPLVFFGVVISLIILKHGN